MKKLIFTLLALSAGYAAQAQNVIEGYVIWDSLANNAAQAQFKVYLIEHDAVAATLTAVDSQTVNGWSPMYSFSGHPAGQYRTKAAPVPGTVGSSYLVPTYHDSSLYWNNAQVINHTGGVSGGNHIWVLQGTPTTGPGFIGGSIAAGANKGTGGGIAGILVALQSGGQTIKYTYTDGNGDYSFSNLPVGTYTVFPEALNYLTVPATNLSITAAAASISGLNFKQTPTHIMLIPAAIGSLPENDLFSVYPNPANGDLSIRFQSAGQGTASIAISDMTGRVVMTQELESRGEQHIQVAHLPAGTYSIQVTADQATRSEKLIIAH